MTGTANDAHFWNRAARKYAADPIKDMAGYERTLACALAHLKSTDTVLELGCGTGTTALRLAASVNRIVGTDLSSEMIAIARERALAQGCHNAEFTVSAANERSAGHPAFDAVLAFNLLHLVADREAVFSGIRAQMKLGALLISKTPCLSEMNPLIRLAVPVMRAIGKAPFVSFFTAAALEAEIAAAGFRIEERARHGSQAKDPRIYIVARRIS